MKFLHISDIHIGKRVCGFSMLEDQRYILEQIVEIAKREQPDGVLIAGDLYDKAMPSAEAVELADEFLYRFVELGIPVWVISGNHDCAERIAYGSRMMEQAGLYMARVFDGKLQRYTVMREGGVCRVQAGEMAEEPDEMSVGTGAVSEKFRVMVSKTDRTSVGTEAISEKMFAGTVKVDADKLDTGAVGVPGIRTASEAVDIYLLPFVRPAQVRRFFPDQTIETTQQAVDAILAGVKPDRSRVSILVMHQFLAGAAVCDSEELSVGGSDQVAVSSVAAFDYVALGHLHRPQRVGRETVRYCGSPLKYSFSEAGHTKSVTIVETVAAGSDCGWEVENSLKLREGKVQDAAVQMSALMEDGAASGEAALDGAASDEAVLGGAAAECVDWNRCPKVRVRTVPLHARLDLREIRGPIARLLSPEVYREENVRDYLHVTLTDEHEVLDAIGRLREVYPNIMRLDFETRGAEALTEEAILIEEKTPQELFEEFFERQNGHPMSEEQRALAAGIWTASV